MNFKVVNREREIAMKCKVCRGCGKISVKFKVFRRSGKISVKFKVLKRCGKFSVKKPLFKRFGNFGYKSSGGMVILDVVNLHGHRPPPPPNQTRRTLDALPFLDLVPSTASLHTIGVSVCERSSIRQGG